ncbi:uncharacterized protein LOC125329422 [Corvus hawaiiensis]|uniref:uncharacterized protein LOC125329422 n=1 Tax=Corvus hawaiiensis TaxID=134902 RepID=UPI002019CD81|nr:uncharacterized protein LOC125329422 [Corvus hawaiiensis]
MCPGQVGAVITAEGILAQATQHRRLVSPGRRSCSPPAQPLQRGSPFPPRPARTRGAHTPQQGKRRGPGGLPPAGRPPREKPRSPPRLTCRRMAVPPRRLWALRQRLLRALPQPAPLLGGGGGHRHPPSPVRKRRRQRRRAVAEGAGRGGRTGPLPGGASSCGRRLKPRVGRAPHPSSQGICQNKITEETYRTLILAVRLWRPGRRSRLEPVKIQECPAWYLHLFQAAVPVGAAQRRAASAGVGAPGHRSAGTAWLPDTCAGPSRTERGWQRPSAASGRRERRLAPDLSMSAAEAPDTQDPDGVGTLPEDVPSLKEIEQLLNTGRPSCNHVDEVWPNLFLGDLVTAHNRFVLWKMGVTHVLNAAHGTAYSHGGQDFYGATIDYYGVQAHDLPSFDISQFFFSAAQFIHNALSTPGAKILVHCAVGVSRSASLVLAYLMINHHLPLVEAIKTVKEHRWISPNRGFLKHLRNLDVQLQQRKDC